MKTGIAGRSSRAAAALPLAAVVALSFSGFPVAVFGRGLSAVELKSYYEPDPTVVRSVQQPWILPLPVEGISNATFIRARLELGSNAWTALERNGFVVVPYGPATNVIDTYACLRHLGLPLFASSDAVLHLYHVQFDDILMSIETNQFLPRLTTMTAALLEESLRQQSTYEGDLREAAFRNSAFLCLAARLLGQTMNVPPNVSALADQEIYLINAHIGFGTSPIFRYLEDYSQYVPRGHYVRSEDLKKYFKVMMCYGRMAFLLKGSNNPGPLGEALVSIHDARIQTLQASLLALALDRLQAGGQPIADTWNRIYAVTAFFVGLADDLTPYEYKEAIESLFGVGVQPEQLDNDQNLFLLKRALARLRSPEIYGGTGNCEIPADATPADLERLLEKTKGMRVMGQRFIPDSFMFQQLVSPAVGPYVGEGTPPFSMGVTAAGPRRCFPRGLDVMAVLGSRLALQVLDREGDTAYVGYDEAFNRLSQEFSGFPPGEWHRNLYWGWLDTLRPLLARCDSGYPSFMRTRAWQAKQLNTALASWAELRHDTILYAKQSYTPVNTSVPPTPDSGYAEPVPEFYQHLRALVRLTRTGLDDMRVLSLLQRDRLLSLEYILTRLRDIAVAELESRELTEPELTFLIRFDEELRPLTNGTGGMDVSSTLVADVHTDGNTAQVLEEGTGYLNVIVVAYRQPNGRITFAAGPVMSYYEFKWPMSDRLTDERWCQILASGTKPATPAWTRLYAEPVSLPSEDLDGDRLPDFWELTFWPDTGFMTDCNDPDRDGLTNEQEFLAGTDPGNPQSCLRLSARRSVSGPIELNWQTVLGRTYRLRWSEDLVNWRLLGLPFKATGDTGGFLDPSVNDGKCRFYQVEVVP